ncbi:MAG: twin-arginine translocase TatA/TatE family subunit [Terrimesophilobacter sp.]
MFSGFTGWHALIILVVVVLLFGATKLPGLAKSVGQSMKIFRSEMKSSDSDSDDKAKDTTDDSQSTPKS